MAAERRSTTEAAKAKSDVEMVDKPLVLNTSDAFDQAQGILNNYVTALSDQGTTVNSSLTFLNTKMAEMADALYLRESAEKIVQEVEGFKSTLQKSGRNFRIESAYITDTSGITAGAPKMPELTIGKTYYDMSPTERLVSRSGNDKEMLGAMANLQDLTTLRTNLMGLLQTFEERLQIAKESRIASGGASPSHEELMLAEISNRTGQALERSTDEMTRLNQVLSDKSAISQFVGEVERLSENFKIASQTAGLVDSTVNEMRMGGSHPLARVQPSIEALKGASLQGLNPTQLKGMDKFQMRLLEETYKGGMQAPSPQLMRDLAMQLS